MFFAKVLVKFQNSVIYLKRAQDSSHAPRHSPQTSADPLILYQNGTTKWYSDGTVKQPYNSILCSVIEAGNPCKHYVYTIINVIWVGSTPVTRTTENP